MAKDDKRDERPLPREEIERREREIREAIERERRNRHDKKG